MMEGEEIGMVLARASELRSKMTDCIDSCGDREADPHRRGGVAEDEDEDEDEADSLVSIRDALESLEQQLSSLQALQHQQRYEREASLAQIDRSRMILLSKLKEYKGEDLEVIHEASTFAGGSIDYNEDLLLPPYPSHFPDSYDMDDLYPFARLSSKYKSARNKLIGEDLRRIKKSMDELEEHQCNQPVKRDSTKGIRGVVGLLAKSALMIVSVISVLSLAGFKPTPQKRGIQFNILDLFDTVRSKETKVQIQCPPGKVLLMEDGKPRCIVKERVEIPFELDVTGPNIKYGFG